MLLLLFTLVVLVTASSTQDQDQSSCPHVEVLRGRDGETGSPGDKGDRGDAGIAGPQGPVGEKGDRGDPGERGGIGVPGLQGPSGGGAVYTRWGRTICPSDQETQLVYSGRAGGNPYTQSGGGANFLCLPNNPDHLASESGVQGKSYIGGVNYYFGRVQPQSSKNSHNAPCAVCYTPTRSVVLMIPAKIQCPTNWTVEYVGYLMTEWKGRNGRTNYECVDNDPESIPGLNGLSSEWEGNIHLVEPHCGSLGCPPYNAEKEITCVVCTR